MDKHDVKASVAIITYNQEKFIAQAVESALEQETDFDFEIVIGEDCSTDQTRCILLDLKQKHPERIRLLLRDKNLGSNRNFAATLDACRGQYIALLEGDDFWTCRSKLQQQIEFLDQHPSCTICCHQVRYVDENGEPLPTLFPEGVATISTLRDLLKWNFIQTGSAVVRRGLVDRLPEWFFKLKISDWPFFLLHAVHGDIGYIDRLMAAYRVHSGGLWSLTDKVYRLKNTILVLRHLRPALNKKHQKQLDLSLSLHHVLISIECDRRLQPYAADKHRGLGFRYGRWRTRMSLRARISHAIRPWPLLCSIEIKGYEVAGTARRRLSSAQHFVSKMMSNPRTIVSLVRSIQAGGVPGLRTYFRVLGHSYEHGPKRYAKWVRDFDTLEEDDRDAIRRRIAAMSEKPFISVVMPVYNPAEVWLRKAIESVQRQLYPSWELCIADDASSDPHVRRVIQEYQSRDDRIHAVFRVERGHISESSNSALELASGQFVALLDHDDELAEHALYLVAEEIHQHPDADIIYSDEDKIDERGKRFDPYFKTDWNPDLMRSHNMINHLGVFRTELVRSLGGFRKEFQGSQDYDLALRCIERSEEGRIRHIPHVLYHWRAIVGSAARGPRAKLYASDAAVGAVRSHLERCGTPASVLEHQKFPGWSRVIYELPAHPPLVSVIVATKDKLDLLRPCLDGVLNRTDYANLEIILVDNQSQLPETADYLKSIRRDARVRVLEYEGEFNYSAINNQAVQVAQGSVLCLLNNDVDVIKPDWLKEMVSHALRAEIGAVGAKLLFPDHTLQHAGVLVGARGAVAAHAFTGLPNNIQVPFGRSEVIQNVSAVTAACMVLRRSVFEEVGGFDEKRLAVKYNDVDLCLQINEHGYRIVWTPYAVLYHRESASLGRGIKRKQDVFEAQVMTRRWAKRVLNDPNLNPNLSIKRDDYALAFPPRATKPWDPAG